MQVAHSSKLPFLLEVLTAARKIVDFANNNADRYFVCRLFYTSGVMGTVLQIALTPLIHLKDRKDG